MASCLAFLFAQPGVSDVSYGHGCVRGASGPAVTELGPQWRQSCRLAGGTAMKRPHTGIAAAASVLAGAGAHTWTRGRADGATNRPLRVPQVHHSVSAEAGRRVLPLRGAEPHGGAAAEESGAASRMYVSPGGPAQQRDAWVPASRFQAPQRPRSCLGLCGKWSDCSGWGEIGTFSWWSWSDDDEGADEVEATLPFHGARARQAPWRIRKEQDAFGSASA